MMKDYSQYICSISWSILILHIPGASTGARGFTVFRTSFLWGSGNPSTGPTLFLTLLFAPLSRGGFVLTCRLTSLSWVFSWFLLLVGWFVWTFWAQRLLGSTLGYLGSTCFGRPLFFKLHTSFRRGFICVIIVQIPGHLRSVVVIEIARPRCVRFIVGGFALRATSGSNRSWFAKGSTGRCWLTRFARRPATNINII